jgi:hypothetical protein
MTGSADRFGDAAIQNFIRRLGPMLGAFGFDASAIEVSKSKVGTLLASKYPDNLHLLGEFLESSTIGRRWNRVLAADRAPFLAELLAPHVAGTLLDLLCGNGAVARSLQCLIGAPVAMVERFGCDDGQIAAAKVLDFSEFRSSNRDASYDTVLLCTVLHHERDPITLLSMAAQTARRRIIVVENCIDEGCPMNYQELVDLIFNESLNRTSLPCPGSHRTVAEWLSLCTQFGQARVVGAVDAVPGIPLSHDLIVIEKSP